jgi:ABC-type glycerol-3-phosphate transport system substrate-binding protein
MVARRERKQARWFEEVTKAIGPKYPLLSGITQLGWMPYVREAVSLWNKQHPKGWLELELYQAEYVNLKARIKGAIRGGEVLDFSLIDSIWVAEFAEGGLITPLEEIDPSLVKSLLKEFYPKIIEGDSWKGKHYAIRTGSDTPLLWYRKDWFAEEKLSPPETWDELIKVATHFNQSSVKKKYGIEYPLAFVAGVSAGEETTFTILPFFWSNGGDSFKDGKVVLQSEQNKETLGFLRDLVHKYKVASPEVTSYEWYIPGKLFAEEKVAMGIGGARPLAVIQENLRWSPQETEEKFGYIPIPASPRGEKVTNVGGMAYVIYKDSNNKEIALELINLITGRDLMYEFCVKSGINPVRKDVTQLLKSKFLSETSKYLEFARTRPNIPHYSVISKQFQTLLERAISGSLSIEDALKGATESISFITGYPKD